MNTKSKAHAKHVQAEKERENDKHEESLKLLDEAIPAYEAEGDYKGAVLARLSKGLANKHLYLLRKEDEYKITAKTNVQDALQVAKDQEISDILSTCYFHMGQTEILFDNYKSAIEHYQLALTHYQGTHIEHGYFTYHLGEALFRNGQKNEGKETIRTGLEEIASHMDEVGTFEAHVWLTGGYMRLAELIFPDNPEEAHSYLAKTQEIIDAYDKEREKTDSQELVIRKRQLEELRKKLQ